MTLRAWVVIADPDRERRGAMAVAAERFLDRFGRGRPVRLESPAGAQMGTLSVSCDLRANRTPEQPVRRTCLGTVFLLAFDGWLENADGLAHELGVSAALSDEELIVSSFDRWGAAAFERLVGEYSFVLGTEAGQFFAVRDKGGVRPLCHAGLPGGWACANLPGLLASLPGVDASPDWVHIAEYLAAEDPRQGRTLFAGVRRVAGGHLLRGSHEGDLKVEPYWAPESTPLAIGREEAIAGVAQRVRAAVRGAVRGYPFVASHLSGGIDSSTVSLVLDELVATGDLGAAEAGTVSIVYPGQSCDETQYIDAVCAQLSLSNDRFEAEFFSLDQMRQFSQWLNYPLAPQHGTAQSALVRAVVRRGGCVLTGEGGDELFEPTDWAVRRSLCRIRDWSALGRLLCERVRSRDPSARWRGQIRHVLTSLFGEAFFATIDRRLGRRSLLFGLPIDTSWAEEVHLHELAAPQPTIPGARTLAMACTRSGAWSAAWDVFFVLSVAHGVEYRHPLSSSELMSFCNRLPLAFLDGQTPFNRELLRMMHGDRLPPTVRRRRDKAEFTGPTLTVLRDRVYHQGFRPGQEVVLAPGRRVYLPDDRVVSIWPYEAILSLLLWWSVANGERAVASSLHDGYDVRASGLVTGGEFA